MTEKLEKKNKKFDKKHLKVKNSEKVTQHYLPFFLDLSFLLNDLTCQIREKNLKISNFKTT